MRIPEINQVPIPMLVEKYGTPEEKATATKIMSRIRSQYPGARRFYMQRRAPLEGLGQLQGIAIPLLIGAFGGYILSQYLTPRFKPKPRR